MAGPSQPYTNLPPLAVRPHSLPRTSSEFIASLPPKLHHINCIDPCRCSHLLRPSRAPKAHLRTKAPPPSVSVHLAAPSFTRTRKDLASTIVASPQSRAKSILCPRICLTRKSRKVTKVSCLACSIAHAPLLASSARSGLPAACVGALSMFLPRHVVSSTTQAVSQR